ncbi:hypothetical protein FV113G1_P20280 (plasmid) [Fusobacterium varium]|nr:hypothetical protein FV113G1_P20280 [Fusobacterium varium]
MNINNLNINFENILFDMLSWESGLYLNKKLIGFFGLELAAITSYLISQAKYHKENYSMTEDGFFYATDLDIILYVGIKNTRITEIKREGLEYNLFTIEKRGMPQKTYYKINYEQLIKLFSTDKTFIEISFNRLFTHENLETPFELTESSILKLSYAELRMLCKILKIKYSGKSKKQDLIDEILKNQELIEPKKETFSSVQKNRTLNKSSIKHKSSQCVNLPHTSVWNFRHKLKSYKHKTNIKNHDQEEKKVDLDFFENLFKKFKINFTKTNQEAVKKLLVSLSSQKKVEEYLRETYNNIQATPGVKDPARLFSAKIAKGERQVIPKAAMKKIMHSNSDQETENEEILIKQEKVLKTELNYLLGYVKNNFKTPIEAYQDMVNFTKKKEYNSILIEKYLLKMKDCLSL